MAQLTLQQAFDVALQHHQAGRLKIAEELYWQILSRQPEHVDAMQNLGVLAHQVGRNDVAIELLRRAADLRPRDALTVNNLGNACKGAHRLDDAITAYRRAISLRPSYAEAQYNLAAALCEKGDEVAAIAAYKEAISLRPDFVEAHCNLGSILCEQGKLDEAIAAFNRAIAIRPNAAAYHNLGNAFSSKGQVNRAIEYFRQAIALAPMDTHAHSSLIYSMLFDAAYNDASIAEELRRWDAQHAQPLRQAPVEAASKGSSAHPNDKNPDRRLRIGYVSPDFRDHVVAHNLLPLFRQHDRERFEITCYAHVPKPDDMTREIESHADRWRRVEDLPDEQVANQIREDGIDILVDLALHTAHGRLLVFARKPAPVQVTFAGYPGSTGLTAIDYRLSDPYLDPVGAAPGLLNGRDESVYSERTIRLPDSFWCFEPGIARDIPLNRPPMLEKGTITFGCLNKFCKVNDGVLTLWARVLRNVEHSHLLLLTEEGTHRQRTLDQLSKEGIDPARIEFSSRQPQREYLELYHRVDIGLDTFPYNGHTTSLDSLWMGVPVVTLVGETAVSRAGWCQLSNLRLTELAAESPDDFVRIAADLANNLPRLADLRSTLRHRMEQSPLMDASKFARSIENAYRQMWLTYTERS